MLVVGRVSSYLGAHKPRPVGDHLKLSQVGRYPFGTSGKFMPYSHCCLYTREASDIKKYKIINYIKSVDVW